MPKVRKLVFTESGEEREYFTMVYQGYVTGGNTNAKKSLDTYRREADLLDQLEEISDEIGTNEPCKECGQPNLIRRVLKPGEHTLRLRTADFEMLTSYFEATQWTTKASRRYVTIRDWLHASPTETEGG